jgi:hypothetical protein
MVLMNNNRWNIFSTYEQWPTSPRKTRVRVFRRRPSSRLSWRGHVRSMFTPSLRRCAYQIVAGRSAWLNRDPIQEFGGINLYKFVHNHPNVQIDSFGLCECEKENPAKDLFKNAADNLAAALGGKGGKIVRLLLLAADAKKGCGDMNAAAGACGDFAKQEAADPGYASGQFDCETCCHGIMDSFPGLGGFSYFQCHAMCAKF